MTPPLINPFISISEFKQTASGPEAETLTCCETTIDPDNTLSPHSFDKVSVYG